MRVLIVEDDDTIAAFVAKGLEEAGFERLLDELVTVVEPEPDGEGVWQWVLCSR